MRTYTAAVERLMKRCQIGVGGRNALEDAHDIMAECYGTLGALLAERDELLAWRDKAFDAHPNLDMDIEATARRRKEA